MKLIFYYSGSCGAVTGRKLVAEPEIVLGDRANIMLSYFLITDKKQDQHLRMPEIVNARSKHAARESGGVPPKT